MSAITITVGKRLRNYRIQKDLSQEQVAELAGIHPTYVGQVERGEKNITLESLEKICHALQISFANLFEGMTFAPHNSDIPLQCYELIHEMDFKTQQRVFRILNELYNIKHEK